MHEATATTLKHEHPHFARELALWVRGLVLVPVRVGQSFGWPG